jgi:hypothetical protein
MDMKCGREQNKINRRPNPQKNKRPEKSRHKFIQEGKGDPETGGTPAQTLHGKWLRVE